MVSFILQESPDCNYERESTLHACCLDARSSFDNVWILGILYMLYHIGVRGKLLRVIGDSFNNITGKVYFNGNVKQKVLVKAVYVHRSTTLCL